MLIKNRALYMVADIISIEVAFLLAILARFASLQAFNIKFGTWYGGMTFLFAYILVTLFYQPSKPVMKRSSWHEAYCVGITNLYMAFLIAMLFYLSKTGELYSRLFYITFFVGDVACMYLGRLCFKRLVIAYYKKSDVKKKLLVCANEDNVLKVLNKVVKSELYDYEVIAVAVIHEDEIAGEEPRIHLQLVKQGPHGSYMVEHKEEISEFLKKQAVDEALLSLPDCSKPCLEKIICRMETLGMVVRVTANTFGLSEKEKAIERFGVYHVLTYCPRVFEVGELALKRAMDIAGGMAGVLLTLLLGIVVAPLIYIESPGPVVFKQTRIGKNGRRFRIYKFRSMYMDAEERKKQLMSQNEMSGLMFKMKDDPRITKIGKFIRKTSIDEFPQFFNVLMGDMSLVGTRPPTEDEFLQYEERHKRRLSLKPGITGMWQVSGRSSIQEFDDVVKLDLTYIDNWSIWMDIRILCRTVQVVLLHKGAE